MKLYMVPLAPNPTKVMLYIAERELLGPKLGIQQIVVNTVKGRHREPEHIARNPFAKLPVLELDTGEFLIESLSIIQYLEHQFPEGAILPEDPLARARALELERIIELQITIPMGQFAHATNSPLGRPADPERAATIKADLPAAMNYLESKLDDGRHMLTGGRASIADFTLQSALQFLRFVKADLLEDYPNLQAWDARFRETPAAKAVLKW
jgi:glutathione S-transferase